MKQPKEISSFFERITVDNQLYPSHISIFVSLFQSWSVNSFQNPFRICRENVMKSSKIKSFATYHKCIKDLHNAGYIIYSPNYNSYKGSLIEIIDFEKVKENKIIQLPKTLLRKETCFSIPMLCEIEMYFEERDLFSHEANKFYSFYQSNNWKLSNNKPMKSWQAAARNWISKLKNHKNNSQ